MHDWTGGYMADIAYTHGYYHELNPLRIGLAFANAELEAPATGVACELGFGQGLSCNIHAAASITRWHGTDFNPAQAAFAQELAGLAGTAANFVDQPFAEFCARDDLPDFDFIALHGIWSWISADNRAVIVEFIRRKLKVGGVLYISYNCHPGWAPMAPVRGLLTQYADSLTAPGMGMTARIDSALGFAGKLLETQPAYFTAYPQVAERLKSLRSQNRHYLAHEYFNQDWEPTSFATMAQVLGEAKLSYACSAHFIDHIAAVNLNPQQQELLAGISDPVFCESVRDFMVNQNFRRDYWVKGARRLSPLQRTEAMRRQRLVLVTPRAQVDLLIKGNLHEGKLSDAIYGPVLDLLADHQPRTLGEIEAALGDAGPTLRQLFEAAIVLVGKGNLMLAQDAAHCAQAYASAQRLNRALFERARDSEDISNVAAPLVGAGVTATRIPQLFLLAWSEGRRDAAALTASVWDILAAQGQHMVKDGQLLEQEADSIAELQRQADSFVADYLPMYRALGVIA